MKRLLLPLIILLLAACQREAELPEATSAAKDVYMQYADRKDLTVAIMVLFLDMVPKKAEE